MKVSINPLTPNAPYRGCTAPLTSKRCILYIYSTNIGTEYFKHGIYSPFFSSKCSLFRNSNVFGSCIIHILYTGCAKIKKKGQLVVGWGSEYLECCHVTSSVDESISVENCGIIINRGNRVTQKRNPPISTLPTTNPKWSSMIWNRILGSANLITIWTTTRSYILQFYKG